MFRDLTQSYKKFDPYLEYYPGPGEEGADGIHDGEIKGLREDAPEDAKKAFEDYLAMQEYYRSRGIK